MSRQTGNNMMDALKSNMMTMLMINNMNGGSRSGPNGAGGGSKDMFSMLYVFVATSVVDAVFKHAPTVFNFFLRTYYDKIDTIKKDLSCVTKDPTDNKVKKKTASITITISVNNPENVLGVALLDFITNNKNTTHVSYIRESFILNQKDVINIDEDVFARMTESTSGDHAGGSTSTNVNSGAGGHNAIVQVVEVYSFTKTTDQLRHFLDDIKQKYTINVKNKLGNKRYYFNMHPLAAPMDIHKKKNLSALPPNFVFTMKHFQTNRKFSNLFGEDIDTIRQRVNFFVKNRKWYDEKGIPYTLGLLLSGNPGTGKTSTIKCLANETNRHICNINLNNDMTKTQLENLFFSENINVLNPHSGQQETYCIPLDQRIYVLEDVDCQSDMVKEREVKPEDAPSPKQVQEHYEDKNKVDLSFLLNLLDGILENPGRIVIMTSNFPDTLDSALIRPGRIDVIAKFRKCSNQTVVQMIEFFYDMTLSREEKGRIQDLIEGIVTPAELSKIMFENFSVYEATLDHMKKLSRDAAEQREQERWKLEAEEVLNRRSMETIVDNIEMVVRDEGHDESDDSLDSVVGIECIDHGMPTLECIDPLTHAEAGENVDESCVPSAIGHKSLWSFTNANPEFSLSSASSPFTPFDPLVNNASYGSYRTETVR
jgi:DNA polymerase III delta prime subunit